MYFCRFTLLKMCVPKKWVSKGSCSDEHDEPFSASRRIAIRQRVLKGFSPSHGSEKCKKVYPHFTARPAIIHLGLPIPHPICLIRCGTTANPAAKRKLLR